MIEIYKPFNKDFEKNGDITLTPETCAVKAELNGLWELNIEHPIDDIGRWKLITEGAVIAAPFCTSKKQLFRIFWIQKNETSIEAKARPIFMDAADEVFLKDVRPTDKNAQDALNIMLSGQDKYSASSNIQKYATAYYTNKNLVEALQGDTDQSFINRWGGEVYYENYHVFINEHIGNGTKKRIENGLIREGVECEIDTESMATRLIPMSYNGYGITGDVFYVDSPLIKKYPKVYAKTVEFSEIRMAEDAGSDPDKEWIICSTDEERNAALRKKCEEMYESGIDKPTYYFKAPLIDLAKTEEYKDLKGLEELRLGDEIIWHEPDYDVEITEKIIGLTYDCIGEKNDSVDIGQWSYNCINELQSTIDKVNQNVNTDGTLKAERIQGIIEGVRTMMRAQATEASPSPVRATIFEDLNPASQTYGALCLGTMGFQIAYQRTADGTEWDWRTFGTGKGFYADCIVAGTMMCDRIRGGTLKLGGLDNVDGLLQILDESGGEIGSWGKDGIAMSKGVIRSSDYEENKCGMEIDLNSGTVTIFSTEIINETSYTSKCVLKDGALEILDLKNGKSYIKAEIYKKDGSYAPRILMRRDDYSAIIYTNQFNIGKGVAALAGARIDNGDEGVIFGNKIEGTKFISGNEEGVSGKIALPGNGFLQFSNGILINSQSGTFGKSGRAEFSDGSYMHFTDGLLDSGKTSEGGTI